MYILCMFMQAVHVVLGLVSVSISLCVWTLGPSHLLLILWLAFSFQRPADANIADRLVHPFRVTRFARSLHSHEVQVVVAELDPALASSAAYWTCTIRVEFNVGCCGNVYIA